VLFYKLILMVLALSIVLPTKKNPLFGLVDLHRHLDHTVITLDKMMNFGFHTIPLDQLDEVACC